MWKIWERYEITQLIFRLLQLNLSTLGVRNYFILFLSNAQFLLQTIFGCSLAYSLSIALLLYTPICFSSEDHFTHQDSTVDIKSMPSLSFMGQIGHSEYSLKLSQSVRKRQIKSQDDVLEEKDYTSTLNETMESTSIFDHVICGNCGPSVLTLDKQGTFLADQFDYELRDCILGVTCGGSLNDTSFNRVLSFMKLPFHNRSWFYGSVQFPVWENMYSDILIGFKTSTASAAA